MIRIIKLIIWIVVLYLLFSWWSGGDLDPLDVGNTELQTFIIEPGSSLEAIATKLEGASLIASSRTFERYAKKEDVATKLQAGSFQLSPSMSVPAITKALQRALAEEIKFTIPEGFTVQEIDAKLAENDLISKGALVDCSVDCVLAEFDFLPSNEGLAKRGGRLEGYLYPDTYFIKTDSFNVEEFAAQLLRTFEAKIITPNQERLDASKHSLHDFVTMASLIEEETRKESERAMVSGILWERLDIGELLGVDATVRYILNKPSAAITLTDLRVDTPYNTRLYRELPPGPIASPSLSSMDAAMNPESSPYLFYLHGNDGQIRYAGTNAEHEENKAKYL
jgi:UPF0755 protein